MISFFVILILFGASIGSFINVVSISLPRGESFFLRRSHCRDCNQTIKWYDNIPVLSWFLLNGRCRQCKSTFSIRYPIVEFSCVIIWLLSYSSSPTNYELGSVVFITFAGGILGSILLLLSLIDLEHMILPSKICLLGLALGLTFNLIYSFLYTKESLYLLLFEHFCASFFALISFELVNKVGTFFLKKNALGRGDAKLVAMGGAWLGLSGIAIAVALSFWMASIYGIYGRLKGFLKPLDSYAFGPFLALGIGLVWFFGADSLWQFWIRIIN